MSIRRIPEDLELTLVYNNFKPKAPLGEVDILSITNNIGDFKYLQFEIKQTIFRNGETIEHPAYDKIQLEQLVLLRDYGYYVIKSVSVTEDETGMKKTVECASIETKLSKKIVELPHKVIQLQKNDLDMEDGILDIFEQETGWKVKYLDENAQYDFIVDGKSLKYRNIEVSETWWNFMSITLQEAFDIVVYFDHLDRTISVFDRKTFGKETLLILSRKNYLENINKSSDNTDLVTRMYVVGDENVSINSVNPLGTSYIEDFSYFTNDEYMSKELIEALELYYPLLDELQSNWYDENEMLLEKQKELINIDSEINKKKEELKAKKQLQTEALKDVEGNPDGDKLKELKGIIDNLESEIASLEEQRKQLEIQIKEQETKLLELSLNMAKENITINGEKLFTKEVLEELDNFIFEGSWDNTYYTTDLTLYYGAKEQIKKICKPTFQMNIGLNQLALNIFQVKAINSELYELGDFVIVENGETSIKKKEKNVFNPILRGNKKSFKIKTESNGRLITDETLSPIGEEVIVEDIIGNFYEIFINDEGRLFTSETKKTTKNKFKIRDSEGDIFTIKVGEKGELFLEEDNVYKTTNDFEKVRIVGYSYNPQTKSTELTLSTEEFSLTQEGKMSSALNTAINSGRVFEKNKLTLEQAKVNTNWIENYYKNALDIAVKEVIGAMGNNRITINENGILLQDVRDLDNVVLLSVAGIMMSEDGLETVRNAITSKGIVAEELMGQVVLSKKVYIADEKGELEINGNLLTIYDNLKRARVKIGEYDTGIYGIEIRDEKSNAVVINSKGMLQRERVTFCDNLDDENPYTFMMPLDAGLSEIREATLWLDPKRFRGYTKSVEGGGGGGYTSSSSSTTTSGSSNVTTSKTNVNTSTSGGSAYGPTGSGWAKGWGSTSQLSSIFGGTHSHYLGATSISTYADEFGSYGILALLTSPTGSAVTGANFRIYGGASLSATFPKFRVLSTSYNKEGSGGTAEPPKKATQETYNIDPLQALYDYLTTKVKPKEEVEEERMKMRQTFSISENTADDIIANDISITEEECLQVILNEAAVYNASNSEHEHPMNHYHDNLHNHNMQHTHDMEHNHKFTVDEHTHPIVFGIYEDPDVKTPEVSIWARVNEGMWEMLYDKVNIRKKYDLKEYLNKVNTLDQDDLVEFQIRAKTRARIEGSMLMKCMTRY